jgi:hypothetical protein
MSKFHIRILGGTCGGAMYVIGEFLQDYLAARGFECRITQQDVVVSRTLPPNVDLVLQVVPTFKPEDLELPLINVRPMLLNLEHPGTIQQIMAVLDERHPAGSLASATAVANWPTDVKQPAEARQP